MTRYAFDEAWRATHGRAATDDEYCDACADAAETADDTEPEDDDEGDEPDTDEPDCEAYEWDPIESE